jgi:hypothetical protein
MSNIKISYESHLITKKNNEILIQVETARALTFSLIAALESKLYEDVSGEQEATKGTAHFIYDEKVLLEVFGETLQDHFNRLIYLIKKEPSDYID